jgi:hypothetical protein
MLPWMQRFSPHLLQGCNKRRLLPIGLDGATGNPWASFFPVNGCSKTTMPPL